LQHSADVFWEGIKTGDNVITSMQIDQSDTISWLSIGIHLEYQAGQKRNHSMQAISRFRRSER
jgi:hypothetical protein